MNAVLGLKELADRQPFRQKRWQNVTEHNVTRCLEFQVAEIAGDVCRTLF